MAYSNADLEQTGKALAQLLQQQNARMEAIEAKPQLDAMNERWRQGRELANARGFYGEALNDLESWIEKNVVADHRIALAAYGGSPSSGWEMIMGRADPSLVESLIQNHGENFDAMKALRKIRE